MNIYYESKITLVKLSDISHTYNKIRFKKEANGIIKETALGYKEVKTDTLIKYNADNVLIYGNIKEINKSIFSKGAYKKLISDGAILIVETCPKAIRNADTVKNYFQSFEELDIKNLLDEYKKEVETYKNKKRTEKKEKYLKLKEHIKDTKEIYIDTFKEIKKDLNAGKNIKKLIKEYKSKGE